MLLILFGPSGSGKNFTAQLLQEQLNFYFWDADQSLTPDMLNAIKNKHHFTETMRDELTQIIINKIKTLQTTHKNIVVSQALYKEKNRMQILSAFPDAKLIQINASPQHIQTRLTNGKHIIPADYAAQIAIHFEPPTIFHGLINNDSDKNNLLRQIEKILKK